MVCDGISGGGLRAQIAKPVKRTPQQVAKEQAEYLDRYQRDGRSGPILEKPDNKIKKEVWNKFAQEHGLKPTKKDYMPTSEAMKMLNDYYKNNQ